MTVRVMDHCCQLSGGHLSHTCACALRLRVLVCHSEVAEARGVLGCGMFQPLACFFSF